MKSAYEMALARMGLSGEDEPRPLTDAQRAEISDIDRRYSAKIAEARIMGEAELARLRAAGDADGFEKASEGLRRECASLEEDRELAKERVRGE
jgi:flagellar biosynthesis/type III secretory pathway protein FliH